MAVGIGFGDNGSTDRPAATRLVLDDEWVTNLSRDLIEDHARDAVIGIASGKRADDLHRRRGPRLRMGRRRCRQEPHTRDGAAQSTVYCHWHLSGSPRAYRSGAFLGKNVLGRYGRCSTALKSVSLSSRRLRNMFLVTVGKASPIKMWSPSGGSPPLSSALLRAICCSRASAVRSGP